MVSLAVIFKYQPMKHLSFALLFVFILPLTAQKKVLDHQDFEIWNTIENEMLSPNGKYIMYSLERGEADQFLKLKNEAGTIFLEHDRARGGIFTYDSKFAIFSINAWKDSITEMKRRKIKKEDLPKDSLGIYNIDQDRLEKMARVKSFKLPEKWSGYLAFQLEEEVEKKEKDSTESEKKEKKVGKKNGYHLAVRDLNTGQQDIFKFVNHYEFAKEGKRLVFSTTGEDKNANAAVFVLDFEKGELTKVHEARKAKYYQLQFSDTGANLAFVVDKDTTKVQLRPTELFHWKSGMDQARQVRMEYNGLRPSSVADISFSKDESKLYFGLAQKPILKDTTLIDEEIVNVEVWTYNEPRLYTVQEMQLKNDTVKAYTSVVDLKNNYELTQLASESYPDINLTDKGDADIALVSTSKPHELEGQWTGRRARDYAVVNVRTGASKKALTKIAGRVTLSPKGKYIYGYNSVDTTWFAYNIAKDSYRALTSGKVFYNELHDSPSPPWPYGAAGWTNDDRELLVYDRYDIWKFDPDTGEAARLTKGRDSKMVYRYVDLDKEKEYLDINEKWLLTTFDENDKSSGYASFDFKRKKLTTLINGPYRYSTPQKAKLSSKLLFTRESFQEFPDLRVADMAFKKIQKVSNANPQQDKYNWGTNELVTWTSLDGIELTGMLVKPENFDPAKKYPMIVNFYEKSSDALHRHRAPSPGRSTINYSFYTSRGYIIFNPDVHYRIGYPGESAYNCVIPGVTSLIEQGFIDKDNIGVQGHSWGGYQIAYLVTKTDIFKAAEAGAPVPNMISAYGGIRWWTGLSRQFQYEHTQSRIGGTPWEYPTRYLENSPIFNIDKINTPLLIMHNDADGHVPWYQGIEFFVSLRRLGKPSWFLNYNGEPHWPLKLQNRKDFNIRMAQFFDHYLKGEPKPLWMERGVPAMEKGVNQGYELLTTDG